jgi:hypothetical protein
MTSKISPELVEYQRILGKEFRRKELRDGTLFYKEGYDFLDEGTSIGKGDIITPSSPETSRLLQYREIKTGVQNKKEGKLIYDYVARRVIYAEQQINNEFSISGYCAKLLNLCKQNFEDVKFEDIIGIRVPSKEAKSLDSFYHTYTNGLNFWGLTSKIPEQLKEELEDIVAKGMKELHKNKIEYFHPLPMNMRYNFDGKLILNPHQNIEFDFNPNHPVYRSKWRVIVHFLEDIAKIIYIHDWIDNPKRFVEKYLDKDADILNVKSALGYIKKSMEMMEEGECEGLPLRWANLGRVKIKKHNTGRFFSHKEFKKLLKP